MMTRVYNDNFMILLTSYDIAYKIVPWSRREYIGYWRPRQCRDSICRRPRQLNIIWLLLCATIWRYEYIARLWTHTKVINLYQSYVQLIYACFHINSSITTPRSHSTCSWCRSRAYACWAKSRYSKLFCTKQADDDDDDDDDDIKQSQQVRHVCNECSISSSWTPVSSHRSRPVSGIIVSTYTTGQSSTSYHFNLKFLAQRCDFVIVGGRVQDLHQREGEVPALHVGTNKRRVDNILGHS